MEQMLEKHSTSVSVQWQVVAKGSRIFAYYLKRVTLRSKSLVLDFNVYYAVVLITTTTTITTDSFISSSNFK